MEEYVFPTEAVTEVLVAHYVEARLLTDGSTNIDRILELQEELTGTLANPYYVVIDPRTETKRDELNRGKEEEEFAAFLRGPLGDGGGDGDVEVGRR